jgi:hypothetical protein
MAGKGTWPALICPALMSCLLASCSEGLRVPEHLRRFDEVDDIAPNIKKVEISEVRVESQLEGMEETERKHIADELRELAEEALGGAGYEIVSTEADAELSVTYSQEVKTDYDHLSNPTRGRSTPIPSRRRYIGLSVALVDRERMEVLYKRFDLRPPRTIREDQSEFDVLKKEIMKRLSRIFGPSQWD